MLRSRLDFEIICSLDLLAGRAKVYIFLQAEQILDLLTGGAKSRNGKYASPPNASLLPGPPSSKPETTVFTLLFEQLGLLCAKADIRKPLNCNNPHLGISLQLAHLPQLAAKQPLHFLQARFR